MFWSNRFYNYLSRHRGSAGDLGLLVLVMLFGLTSAWQIDIFFHEETLTSSEKALELNEMLLIGGLLTSGLFLYSLRRMAEQRRETRRRLEAEKSLRQMAYQDSLTGMPNRRQYEAALTAALRAPPASGRCHAVLMLDLNGFKSINDVHGHAVGDEVLIGVAQKLLSAVREEDLAARFGGDEFAILCQHLIDAEAVVSIANRIIQAFAEPMTIGEVCHQVGVAIGIALVPRADGNSGELLRQADLALYRAKSQGQSAFCFFEEEMDRSIQQHDRLERDLRAALAASEVEAVFRPQVDLRTESVLGFEVLPHWQHPEFGPIAADRIVAIAEEGGLSHRLSDCLLKHGCRVARQWPDHLTLSVNVYSAQLADAKFPARIQRLLQEAGFDARRLELEVAECTLVRYLESARQTLQGLRQQGVKIVLGNFGTGYSSLYHLRNFELDKIKIDRGFVEAMTSSDSSAGIISALIGLGRGLGYSISADGVSSENHQSALIESGCHQGQGAHFASIMSAGETLALLHNSSSSVGKLQLSYAD